MACRGVLREGPPQSTARSSGRRVEHRHPRAVPGEKTLQRRIEGRRRDFQPAPELAVEELGGCSCGIAGWRAGRQADDVDRGPAPVKSLGRKSLPIVPQEASCLQQEHRGKGEGRGGFPQKPRHISRELESLEHRMLPKDFDTINRSSG